MTIQPQDNNGIFRIVDCKYMYNLATSSLIGCRDLQRGCHHRRHDVHCCNFRPEVALTVTSNGDPTGVSGGISYWCITSSCRLESCGDRR